MSEERQDSSSKYPLSGKAGWAHSLPVKSGGLSGSRPCLLPGNLSRDKAANFLRLQIP